ncbi:putative agamous-like MADS-box protein AGL62-like [Capsicum annuum]|nr:putative agamous-like MADS-box protein AGL62-like [Capsicum annuum]
MFGRPPDLSYMRIIGCLCYATIPHKTDKFGPRAVKSVLMGYGATHKGYRLYDLEHHTLFISRDVIFTETIFPFQTQNEHSNVLQNKVDNIGSSNDYLIHENSNLELEDNVATLQGRTAAGTLLDDRVDGIEENIPAAQGVDVGVDTHVEETSQPVRRRSTRTSKAPLWQKDFVTSTKEEVYMQLPQGFQHDKNSEVKVCKLLKSLYGLKKASRQWNVKLINALVAEGSSTELIAEAKQVLKNNFKIKDLGDLSSRPSITLVEINQKLTTHDFDVLVGNKSDPPLIDVGEYQRLIGKLLYLTLTRPDISYAVQSLSQFIQAPKESHMNATIRVVKYVKQSPGMGILLSTKPTGSLEAYCDADWGSCVNTRRSITGYLIKYGNSLLSWKSKKQSTISRSSAKAEYRSLASTVAEITWIIGLFNTLDVPLTFPVPLNCNSKAAIQIAANPVFHERTKHIDIDCHFIREKVLSGLVVIRYLCSSEKPADVLTKGLCRNQHAYLISKLVRKVIEAFSFIARRNNYGNPQQATCAKRRCCTCELGYDSVSDDYKILKIDEKARSEILALKSGSWRLTNNYPIGNSPDLLCTESLVFVHGTFHWIDDITRSTVTALSISSEVCTEIPLPEQMLSIYDHKCGRLVSVLTEKLCVYVNYMSRVGNNFRFRVMKDYGVTESWTRLFTIPGPGFLSVIPKYRFSDGVVLLCYRNRGLGTVLRTSKAPLELRPQSGPSQTGFVYTESLFFPKLVR